MTLPKSAAKAKPASALFERAHELYRSAYLTDAASILDEALAKGGMLSDESVILRSRLYLREKPSEAIAFLTKALPQLGDDASCGHALTLLGAAYARVGDYRSSQLKFDLASRKLTGGAARVREARTTLAYHRATALWMQRKLDEAEKEISIALGDRASDSYVEALAIKGAIYAAREKYESQAGVLLEAVRTITTGQAINVYHWAHVTAQLAYLCRELPNPSIRNMAFEQVDRVSWTPDLADIQFTALKAVGWRRALEGDYFNAFRYLKRASACAPTTPWQVMAGCDRAYLAGSLGERRWAEQELGDAADLAERVEWRAISGEERIALLLLAELYAPHDGALAMSYVARYQETGDRFAPLLSFNADRRIQAMVAYSLGCVRQHLGEFSEAEESYKEAFEIYDAVGYDWRAGRTAIGLSQVSDAVTWQAIARQKLRHYPMSWLMSQLAAPVVRGEPLLSAAPDVATQKRRGTEDLTPAQHEVYELLLKGISTREVAQELGRSEFTVRNHIKEIFKKLKVNSRAALISSSINSDSLRRRASKVDVAKT